MKNTLLCTALYRLTFCAILIISILLLHIQGCLAEDDFDDGISSYKDDPISKYDELGKRMVNINYIVAKALSRVGNSINDDKNINSVVVGAGSNVGDIYNIHLNGNGSQTASKEEDEAIKNEGKKDN